MIATPTRPALRYHGGKWRVAPWIISHFPSHRIYCEPFGGGASVLLRKPKAYCEVYNDIDQDVVNFFRVLRDPNASMRLMELLSLTPWSRREFFESYEPTDDPVERARRLAVRSFMAHGTTWQRKYRTGFRSKSWSQRKPCSSTWAEYHLTLTAIVDRLQGVVIEDEDAARVIARHDSRETLFYVDPPYLWETRTSAKYRGNCAYVSELTDADHIKLAELLREVRGHVVLSGYPSPLYEELYADWTRTERDSIADRGQRRTEVLWMNFAPAPGLFDVDADDAKAFPNRSSAPENETAPVAADAVTPTNPISYDQSH